MNQSSHFIKAISLLFKLKKEKLDIDADVQRVKDIGKNLDQVKSVFEKNRKDILNSLKKKK